jgi:hypothetical protein
MKTAIYKNRYNDEIKFTQISDNQILMEGGEFYRYGYGNNYLGAYLQYCEDGNAPIDIKTFVDKLFEYDAETGYNPEFKPYQGLVKPTDSIKMVDPAGGPYLTVGTDMEQFGLKGVIRKFQINENNKIVITIK